MATIVLVCIFALGIFLNLYGFFSSWNEPLNKLIAGEPKKACTVDSDCVARSSICSICGNADVVNTKWYPFCPFRKTGRASVHCKPSGPMKASCLQGECKNRLAQNNINSFEDCVNAGYPVMESYPRQCRSADGRVFIETLNETERFFCGDGICLEGACAGFNCRAGETRFTCPQDCPVKENSGKTTPPPPPQDKTLSWQTYRNDYFSLLYPNDQYILASLVLNEGFVIKDIPLGHAMSVHFSYKRPQSLIRYQDDSALRNHEDARDLVYADDLVQRMTCEINWGNQNSIYPIKDIETCAQENDYKNFDPSMELSPVSVSSELIGGRPVVHYQTGSMNYDRDFYLISGSQGTVAVLINTPNLSEQCANEEIRSSVCEGEFNHLYEDFKKILSTIKVQ